jgi:hypothetical protein
MQPLTKSGITGRQPDRKSHHRHDEQNALKYRHALSAMENWFQRKRKPILPIGTLAIFLPVQAAFDG